MARELTYVIRIDDSDARTRVSDLERRMESAGDTTGGAAESIASYEKQVKAAGSATTVASTSIDKYAQTATKATQAADALNKKVTDYTKTVDDLATVSGGKALKAADDLIAKMDAEEAATKAASVATAGLGTQITGAIATMAPYAIAASMVTEVLVDWWEGHQKAALATEEAAAKQDTIRRAFELSHGVTMTYTQAVKYLNEQFERQPAFVDHAATALEHWRIAVSQGAGAAQKFAADDLAKNISGAAGTVQKELGRLNIDTVNKALDELRSHTVLGDAAFNQWAKDIGLSSVTIGVLRESVAAEDKAQQAAAQAAAKHTTELKRQADAYERLVESQMKSIRAGMQADTQRRLRAGGTPLQELVPFVGPMPEDLEVLPPNGAFLDPARLGNLNLKTMAKPWIEKMLGPSLGEQIGAYFSGGQFGQTIVQAMTGGGGMRGAMEGVSSQLGETFTQSWGKSITKALPGKFGEVLGGMVGPLGALVGPLLDKIFSIGGPSQRELAGRDASAQFEGKFKNFGDMVNSIGDAYATIGGDRNEAQAAVKAMLDAQKQGAEAVRIEIERLQGVLDQAAKVKAGAGRYGLNSEQLQQAATDAKDVLDYMSRSNLYTQDQLNQAYYDWQKAMADAGNAAAKAWVAAHAAATGATSTASQAISALQQQRDSIAGTYANEAVEAEMGAVEREARAQVERLDQQIEDQQTKLKAQSEETADAVEGAFADVRITIPIDFSYEMPEFGGINPNPAPIDAIPQATGGDWWVTKPTLFLAGEAGPERATFTPQGKSFARPGGDSGGTVNNFVINAVDAASFEQLLARNPAAVARVALAGIATDGKTQGRFRTLTKAVR